MSIGYNPYRKQNGQFASKAEAGVKAERDLSVAIEAGDTALANKIERVIMDKFPETPKGQELLEKNFAAQAMKARKENRSFSKGDVKIDKISTKPLAALNKIASTGVAVKPVKNLDGLENSGNSSQVDVLEEDIKGLSLSKIKEMSLPF